MLAFEGELTPILVQMVKSANTNGLLDKEGESKHQHMYVLSFLFRQYQINVCFFVSISLNVVIWYAVFQLDFEIFRTIASFMKISSGHILIIKLIFIKFFRTMWEIGEQMSWDWYLAELLDMILYIYCMLVREIWKFIQPRVSYFLRGIWYSWVNKLSYLLNPHAINVLLYRMKPRKHIHVNIF